MSDSGNPRILIVDDDTDGLEVLETRLVHAGYEVETKFATKPREAKHLNSLETSSAHWFRYSAVTSRSVQSLCQSSLRGTRATLCRPC